MASETPRRPGRVRVSCVRGRYPIHAGTLDETAIEASVETDGDEHRIRLDDVRPGHSDFWLEITLEVSREDRDEAQ